MHLRSERAATGTRLRQHIHARPITVDVTSEADAALELMEDQHVSCCVCSTPGDCAA